MGGREKTGIVLVRMCVENKIIGVVLVKWHQKEGTTDFSSQDLYRHLALRPPWPYSSINTLIPFPLCIPFFEIPRGVEVLEDKGGGRVEQKSI